MQLKKRCYPLLAYLIGVMLFVCSCNNTPGSSTTYANGQTVVATPTPSPTPIPPVFTSCPATGTARAAVLPPLSAGSHQVVLYTSNSFTGFSGNATSILRRYDTVTGQQADVLKVTIPSKLLNNQNLTKAIDDARTSDNGQWVIFKTAVEGKEAIQMVRSDGQELQTLYCTTTNKDIWDTLSLSPDTKYLAFNELPISAAGNQNLVILELATGKLHVAATASLNDSAVYEPLKWRDHISLYVSYSRIGVEFTRNRRQVYLLPDVTQNSSLQQISIPTITGASNDMCKDFDFSPGNTQLLTSDCNVVKNQDVMDIGPSTIETNPLAGGSPHVIHSSQHPITFARFITNTMIWFSLSDGVNSSENGVWKINADGSGLTRLTTQSVPFELHAYSSNMHISHDGSLFAFFNSSYSGPSTLIFGSMDVSNSHTISVDGQNDDLIGWTTF